MPEVCGFVGCTISADKRCARCQRTFYCSKEHQRVHWKTHKKTCNAAVVKNAEDVRTEDFPVKVVEIDGRGLGVVATRNIKCGELIIQEKPLIDTSGWHSDVKLTEDDLVLVHYFSALNLVAKQKLVCRIKTVRSGYLKSDQQEKIMALHDAFEEITGKKSVYGCFITNTLARGNNSDDSVLCDIISRFNHSCVPNVSHFWVHPYERMVAMRNITEGEELFTSYGEMFSCKDQRREVMKLKYGFDCNCTCCNLPVTAQRASDYCRLRLNEIDEYIGKAGVLNPCKGLELLEEFLEILKIEGLDIPVNLLRAGYNGYQIACAAADLSKAKKYIKLAYDNFLACEGEGSDTVIKMKGFLESPKSHPSWALKL